jgi:hypothetical protein
VARGERGAWGGLGALTLVSAYMLLAMPAKAETARHTHVHSADASSIEWVAAPHTQIGVTPVPAVTTPTESVEFPPTARDPMVLATAVLEHRRLIILSLRGGLHGP